MPTSVYTKNYFRKLNYYGLENGADLPNWALFLMTFLGLSLIVTSGLTFHFYKKSILPKAVKAIEKPLEDSTTLYDKLTLKEREILGLIKEGKSNKEIASQLFIGISTVKTHINKIYSKLEVRSRKEVVSKLDKMKS